MNLKTGLALMIFALFPACSNNSNDKISTSVSETQGAKPKFVIVKLTDDKANTYEEGFWEHFREFKVNEQILKAYDGFQPSLRGPRFLRSTDNMRVVGVLGIGFVASYYVEYDKDIPVEAYFMANLEDQTKKFLTLRECLAFYEKESE